MTTHLVRVERDVRVPTGDPDVTLSADVYRPVRDEPVPALLTVVPYRNDAGGGLSMASELEWFAAHGYASALLDPRGIGASDGSQREVFDPAEADDAIAAIDWLTAQPWCTGRVGMWGHSYGAFMAWRTATRRPPQLKALVPVMGLLDPERDFVHPDGLRGGLGAAPTWGVGMLVNQLLPPLQRHGSADQQRRWQARLEMEPWLLELIRRPPDDPAWRSRIVNAAEVDVPSLCIAGWRDLFCNPTVRAFEQIPAPKKLIAGPWMHTMPHVAPVARIDFRAIALRWFDHWLKDVDTGVMDEPAVTVYVQGAEEWRQFDCWPPCHSQLDHSADRDTVLRATGHVAAGVASRVPIAEKPCDATVGALSGLTRLPSDFGLPVDEHDDDMRAINVTSEPLDHDLTIVGRPGVAVTTIGVPPPHLVARLTHVDPDGRSKMITSSAARTSGTQTDLALEPTAYRIPAGHRLRVVIGDADFPRLWPTTASSDETGSTLCVSVIKLSLPVVPGGHGRPVELEPPELVPTVLVDLTVQADADWRVQRDLLNNAVDVKISLQQEAFTFDREHRLQIRSERTAHVAHSAPSAAVMHAATTAATVMSTGETIGVHVELRVTETSALLNADVTVDAHTRFERRWSA